MYKIKVPSIHCMSCVRNIDDAVKESDADSEVNADVKSKTVTIKTTLQEAQLKKLIEEAGYPVESIVVG